MESELVSRLEAIETKVDAVYASSEKTRKYFLAVLIVSVIAFVLPLIGLLFAIPSMLSTYTEVLSL